MTDKAEIIDFLLTCQQQLDERQSKLERNTAGSIQDLFRYCEDMERRLKKLEGNDAFRDSETKAIRKLAESAERQVRYLQEPYLALQSHLDRFHAPKEEKYSFFKTYDEIPAGLVFLGGFFALVFIFSFAVWSIK